MSRRKNIHPYLSDELLDRFKKFVAASGVTESSVVEAALTEYLDQTSHKRMLLKRLNTIGVALECLERDSAITMETLGAFVHLWMVHNPKVPDGREDLQRKAAAPRLAAFQTYVTKQITGGRRFFNDLVEQAVPRPNPAVEEASSPAAVASEPATSCASGAVPRAVNG
jgi:hypothetical protein